MNTKPLNFEIIPPDVVMGMQRKVTAVVHKAHPEMGKVELAQESQKQFTAAIFLLRHERSEHPEKSFAQSVKAVEDMMKKDGNLTDDVARIRGGAGSDNFHQEAPKRSFNNPKENRAEFRQLHDDIFNSGVDKADVEKHMQAGIAIARKHQMEHPGMTPAQAIREVRGMVADGKNLVEEAEARGLTIVVEQAPEKKAPAQKTPVERAPEPREVKPEVAPKPKEVSPDAAAKETQDLNAALKDLKPLLADKMKKENPELSDDERAAKVNAKLHEVNTKALEYKRQGKGTPADYVKHEIESLSPREKEKEQDKAQESPKVPPKAADAKDAEDKGNSGSDADKEEEKKKQATKGAAGNLMDQARESGNPLLMFVAGLISMFENMNNQKDGIEITNKEPEKAPEQKQPEVKAPEQKQPETKAPEQKQPEVEAKASTLFAENENRLVGKEKAPEAAPKAEKEPEKDPLMEYVKNMKRIDPNAPLQGYAELGEKSAPNVGKGQTQGKGKGGIGE